MTQDEINLTIAEYEDAIDKLRTYRAKELDQTKIDEATAKITALHGKCIDAHWLAITSRTAVLEALTTELKAITDKASKIPQLSDAVKNLRDAADNAAKLAGGKEIKCKNCDAKVVYLPNALTALVAVGGKKKIMLTCKNGHTNDYEIATN